MKELETEAIDKLFLELSQLATVGTEQELKYEQLIFAVKRKFPGESRFETALRYIKQAESIPDEFTTKAVEND